ncbi:ABC transporter, probable ATP-binding subunit [Lentisphaera araneosa HTCC2155]|uniref:ABC transporter, probable ATP-binding subunit n=1 Tax=Lentisphaera araneosa HTCC2155 TaxID=313628 RepID=A6DHY9_9BACT|nr:ABC transporter ATP-binding protein [Lentisphaera araneosa]EDM28643.1 ABC transporter, probable ATP-binding subunit [Lentisphaera araneosa HTCC2155]
MIEIKQISKSYDGQSSSVKAVKELNLHAQSGDFLSIHGPSGCGKSTLLMMGAGLLTPDSGEVIIQNQNLYEMNSGQRTRFRALHLNFIFQQFHLVPYLNILENITLPSANIQIPNIKAKALKLIDSFQLSHRLKHKPSQLSVGEQQRVAAARALVTSPSLIFADEPTGNLDDENTKILMDNLSQFCQSGGAVLMVTHDQRIHSYSNKQYSMKNGELV